MSNSSEMDKNTEVVSSAVIVMKGDKLYDFPEEYLKLIEQICPNWEPDPNSLDDVVEQIKKQSKILNADKEEDKTASDKRQES